MTATVEQITEIVRTANRIAASLYGRESGTLKADGTWVTRADWLIEDFLRREFEAIAEARVFGEEKKWTGKESAPYAFVIDPIEGTGPFRDRIPTWGISVAVFREGRPWLGLFSMPAADSFFVGEYGKGARWNGREFKMPAPKLPVSEGAYLGVSSDAHRWNLRDYPGKIRAFGASGFHVVCVATGALHAAMLTRFRYYDIAAAAIILRSAGGDLFYLSGNPVPPDDILNNVEDKPADDVLACHPDSFAETRKYIQR